MNSAAVDMAVDTVSFIVVNVVEHMRHVYVVAIIRSDTTGPDVLMALSSAYLISLMHGVGNSVR